MDNKDRYNQMAYDYREYIQKYYKYNKKGDLVPKSFFKRLWWYITCK